MTKQGICTYLYVVLGKLTILTPFIKENSGSGLGFPSKDMGEK